MGKPEIDSPQNQYVKQFRALASKQSRAEQGLMQIEGLRILQEAMQAGAEICWAAFCPDRLTDPKTRAVLEALRQHGRPIWPMTARAFDALSDVRGERAFSHEVRAVCRIPQYRLSDLPATGRVRIVAVYELRDPGNMAAMIRSADAFGCAGVVALENCVDFFSPKVVRTTAGSVFHLPLVAARWAEFPGWAAQTGVALVATAVREGTPFGEVAYPTRTALLIGSEAHGLPAQVLAAADTVVSVPMPGTAESLNAAVAAGLVLYEMTKGSNGGK